MIVCVRTGLLLQQLLQLHYQIGSLATIWFRKPVDVTLRCLSGNHVICIKRFARPQHFMDNRGGGGGGRRGGRIKQWAHGGWIPGMMTAPAVTAAVSHANAAAEVEAVAALWPWATVQWCHNCCCSRSRRQPGNHCNVATCYQAQQNLHRLLVVVKAITVTQEQQVVTAPATCSVTLHCAASCNSLAKTYLLSQHRHGGSCVTAALTTTQVLLTCTLCRLTPENTLCA